jgi:signal transduction histidine kinase
MEGSTHRRTLWLFGVLAAYVLLQFLWWAYLLIEKDNELRALIGQLDALGVRSTLSHGDRSRTLLMVAGEGFVFVTLLLIGLWTIYRSVRHELVLARLQRNFLLAASHELRTPIAGLKLHLQTLQRRQLDAGQQRSLMTMALGDVERLGALSEKILLATRLEEARLPLQRAPLDLTPLLNGLVEQARGSYGRDHRIGLDAPMALPVVSDADAVRTIVGNLLENACKYAPPGTAVTITARRDQAGTVIEVADEGPGVPADERERIFDRFHRGGREETRQTKGTGLGLFIVRRLAEALGDSVTLRNGRTHGAIFAVALPDR